MRKSAFGLATVCLGCALIGARPASAAILTDDFTGSANAAPNSTLWSAYNYSGAGKNTLDGAGHVLSNVNTTAYGNYVGVVTKASNFDPFNGPLTIELDGIAVGGGTTSNSNNGFLLYGRSNNSNLSNLSADNYPIREYHPDPASMAYGVATLVSRTSGGYSVTFTEYSDVATGGQIKKSVALSGAPTGLNLTIDGENKLMTVTVEGTTFADLNASHSEALSAAFTPENLSVNGTLTSRIAFGATNGATPTSNSTFTIDAISVAVPEPASMAVFAGAGLLLARRRRRA